MAEETSLKASEPNRAIRVVVGVAVIGVLLAALGWMVPHFIAQPARATLTQETPTGMSSGYAPHWKAEEIVEVPFGETVVLALGLFRCDEAVGAGQLAHLVLRQLAQRKQHVGERVLGEVVQHVALILRARSFL